MNVAQLIRESIDNNCLIVMFYENDKTVVRFLTDERVSEVRYFDFQILDSKFPEVLEADIHKMFLSL